MVAVSLEEIRQQVESEFTRRLQHASRAPRDATAASGMMPFLSGGAPAAPSAALKRPSSAPVARRGDAAPDAPPVLPSDWFHAWWSAFCETLQEQVESPSGPSVGLAASSPLSRGSISWRILLKEFGSWESVAPAKTLVRTTPTLTQSAGVERPASASLFQGTPRRGRVLLGQPTVHFQPSTAFTTGYGLRDASPLAAHSAETRTVEFTWRGMAARCPPVAPGLPPPTPEDCHRFVVAVVSAIGTAASKGIPVDVSFGPLGSFVSRRRIVHFAHATVVPPTSSSTIVRPLPVAGSFGVPTDDSHQHRSSTVEAARHVDDASAAARPSLSLAELSRYRAELEKDSVGVRNVPAAAASTPSHDRPPLSSSAIAQRHEPHAAHDGTQNRFFNAKMRRHVVEAELQQMRDQVMSRLQRRSGGSSAGGDNGSEHNGGSQYSSSRPATPLAASVSMQDVRGSRQRAPAVEAVMEQAVQRLVQQQDDRDYQNASASNRLRRAQALAQDILDSERRQREEQQTALRETLMQQISFKAEQERNARAEIGHAVIMPFSSQEDAARRTKQVDTEAMRSNAQAAEAQKLRKRQEIQREHEMERCLAAASKSEHAESFVSEVRKRKEAGELLRAAWRDQIWLKHGH